MIERSMERRALPREVINAPALLSFDGITGVHPCVVRDINAFGACLSAPYYIFASEFDLLFSGFHNMLACRVVWRRATLSGVVFVVRRRSPKPESASIIELNVPNALLPAQRAGDVCVLPSDLR
ncbi:PilZ domain-containing protein [Bradyrhizobium cytisi]|uniref:PilZ domain-containing protein n=1 Tax=Bradyrhizobium cytisi TaxID=515489 RepID=A0A5S4WPT4_9BRAD|nr:PilZ domain-containing protein [Bradyrhizobium cytisi]TYL83567.1 PilZ domain-containing protein [Bradyrhizobium cytisi]